MLKLVNLVYTENSGLCEIKAGINKTYILYLAQYPSIFEIRHPGLRLLVKSWLNANLTENIESATHQLIKTPMFPYTRMYLVYKSQ